MPAHKSVTQEECCPWSNFPIIKTTHPIWISIRNKSEIIMFRIENTIIKTTLNISENSFDYIYMRFLRWRLKTCKKTYNLHNIKPWSRQIFSKLPIIDLYLVWSTSGETLDLLILQPFTISVSIGLQYSLLNFLRISLAYWICNKKKKHSSLEKTVSQENMIILQELTFHIQIALA